VSPEPTPPARDQGVIRRYFEHLPVSSDTPIVTLGEGGTPLVFSERLSQRTGAEVWLKCEGLNPTGSFKDRGMTVAISKALEEGARAVLCASTGNTSASAAAYSRRAGLVCGVLLPGGHVPLGKLAQTLAHGARLMQIDANFDAALKVASEIAHRHPVTLVNSVNPHRIEGQKTAAFEIVETLGRAPDLHLMPVGNAGNITAHWRGYREAAAAGWSAGVPAMHGWQAEGADPIVRGQVVREPETIATAIRIGDPASWAGALDAAQSSGGAIGSVGDTEILDAWRWLADEGVFVEPASATGVAGLMRMSAQGGVTPGAVVVCVLTGHGLKDPDRAIEATDGPLRVPADVGPIIEQLDLA
jgi:threonine synthase